MKKIIFYFSLLMAKIMYLFLKVTNLSSGSAIIGYFVLKICPDFLTYANKYVRKSKINVTGTNGKTTTSSVLAHILKTSESKIIYNSTGANMMNGIVNSMSLQINPFQKHNFSVIETDEAFLEKLYDKYDADILLVTNLFNDQLDRFGKLENTRELIQKAIDKKPDLQLILNADDPFIVQMSSKNKTPVYYGVENVVYVDKINDIPTSDNVKCACGKDLTYTKRFYSKIGHYNCDCGFKRPETKYSAEIFIHSNHCVIKISGEDFTVPVMGLFNAYNVVGAIVLALEVNISVENIRKALQTYKVFSGRCEHKTLNGHNTIIQLIKNPVGATEVLKTVDLNSNIFIGINDNYADGRDYTWINDAHFEVLKDAKKEIVVSGIRADEMDRKLQDIGCKKTVVIKNVKNAIDYLAQNADNNITILPTYTVLQEINKTKKLK